MLVPLLIKDATTTIAEQPVPASPGLSPISFWMFACPLPLGWTYNQYRSGSGPLLPNSAATYANWIQIKQAPTEYAPAGAGYEFKSIESLTAINSSFSPAATWIPVYGEVTDASGTYTVLTGFLVPRTVATALPPRYYGPIAYMTFITFDAPTASNGYPTGAGPFVGTYYVPTLTGTQRVRQTFVKDFRGVLLPTGEGDPLPAYCSRQGSAKVVMLSGFPGRPAVVGRPAVYYTDDHAGWNAGANSLVSMDTDASVRFGVDITTAGAVGFAWSPRTDRLRIENLSHAFYFDVAPNGSRRVRVLEAGQVVAGPFLHDPDSVYEIRRAQGQVTYLIDDGVTHLSVVHLPGEILVGTALYRAGDGVW